MDTAYIVVSRSLLFYDGGLKDFLDEERHDYLTLLFERILHTQGKLREDHDVCNERV